jgi:tRNA-specific 2-thiouridylase
VCFITSGRGRRGFLGGRIDLRPGRVVDEAGRDVGSVDAVELVTVGQRRGLGLPGGGAPRYVVDVDVPSATVRVGPERDLLCGQVALERVVWSADPPAGASRAPIAAQCSAHGLPRPARIEPVGNDCALVQFERRERRVARGQSVVLYEGDEVIGGGVAA